MSLLINYDDYFSGNAHFVVIPNHNLILSHELKEEYEYKICKKNDVFYCSCLINNNFVFLGFVDFFSAKINLPKYFFYAKNKKELMVLEKLLFHTKEEDEFLIENSFAIHPLKCFLCGKISINPNSPFGIDCELIHGRNARRMAE